MTLRAMVLSFIGAGVLAAVLSPAAQAGTDGWRFVKAYRSLSACQGAGQDLVARHDARRYMCQNDYDKAGVAFLDLYTR